MVDVNRMTLKVQEALQQAGGIAARRSHQGIDVEHLLLALLEHVLLAVVDDPASPLRAVGLTRERLMAALRQVRGSQRVTSPDPEATYQALEKYGRDLTRLAAQGKLDPVIGRDDEIRRVIQVLSRRTKNKDRKSTRLNSSHVA